MVGGFNPSEKYESQLGMMVGRWSWLPRSPKYVKL